MQYRGVLPLKAPVVRNWVCVKVVKSSLRNCLAAVEDSLVRPTRYVSRTQAVSSSPNVLNFLRLTRDEAGNLANRNVRRVMTVGYREDNTACCTSDCGIALFVPVS
jgi:hypothetical protein